MAKTLLNSVNEIFRRVSLVAGDSGLLTSLTDSARQVDVDVAVQAVNEGIDELYSTVGRAMPNQQSSSTITLATNTRNYSLASDLVRLHFPLIDRTHNQYIYEYEPGYDALLLLDPEQDDTGQPFYAVIRPTDGSLFLDRAPTSTYNGYVYTYQYDKDWVLSVSTDTVPFDHAVFRAMVPAWVLIWKRERRNEFDDVLFKASIGRAARLLPEKAPRANWNPRIAHTRDWVFGDF